MFGLGSTAQLGIGISISLNNKFSGQADKVNSSMKAMKVGAQNLAASAVRDYRNYATNIAAGAAAVSYGMYSIAAKQSEFQHKINQVYIVGGRDMKRSRAQLEEFSRSMSHEFTRTPTEIAGAMFENVKAGVTSGLNEITRYQVAVATATDEMLDGEEGVAAKLLGITNAMGIPLSKFADVANATTAVANASMSSVRSIGESMEYAAFTAHTFNIPLEQTLALVGKLSQAKITGSAAGTAINNFLTQLSKNSGIFAGKQAQKAWQMLGLDPAQVKAQLNSGDIFGVVSTLDQAAARNPGIKKDVFQKLFNTRGDRGLEAMLESMGSKDPKKSIQGLYESAIQGVKGDIAMKQAKAMQNDVYSDIKFLQNSMVELGISFVKSITPMARIALPILNKGMHVLGTILESPIGIVFGSLAAIVAPLVALRFGIRALNLTIAMSLRTLGMQTAAGGYSGLAGAAWNMAGLGLFRGGNKAMPAGVAVNSAGRLYAAAGSAITHNGKLYRPGSMLPGSYAQSIGFNAANVARGQALGNAISGAGMAAASASMTGGIGSMFGKFASSGLVKFLGIGIKFLPYIGVLYSIYEVVKYLWGDSKDSKKDEEQKDPVSTAMQHDYYQKMFGEYLDPNWNKFKNRFSSAEGRQPFTIVLNNNIDGVSQGTKTINDVMDSSIARDLNTNLFGR